MEAVVTSLIKGFPSLSQVAVVSVDVTFLTVLFFLMDYFIYFPIVGNMFMTTVAEVQRQPFVFDGWRAFYAYAHLAFGFYYFVILPSVGIWNAFWIGYWVIGVFDLSCFAFFRKYNSLFAMVDIIWGGLLFISVYFIFQIFHKYRVLLLK